MSKEQVINKMTDTDVVTELQKSNKELRDKFRQSEQDLLDISLYVDDVTRQRLNHICNLLNALPRMAEDVRPSILNALHGIVSELEYDLQLIAEQNVSEIKNRYDDEQYKVARGY